MKPALPFGLFLLSCVCGVPMILKTKEIRTRLNGLQVLNDTENNVPVTELPWNITENNGTSPQPTEYMKSTIQGLIESPPQWNNTGNNDSFPWPTPLESDQSLNYTGKNVSFPLHTQYEPSFPQNGTKNMPIPISTRLLFPPAPCPLATCVLTHLGSTLQYGDEKAGVLTKDPFGIGRR
ncbi:hypothetical protein AAFF_G00029180 [Aldrovandia affinis]|uniref:Uncharacterized protein n=1 Tax=Aldrovandia affinis TaxID=143900 RepID=A0AAD7WFZ2_9TELE|nr:hypothetical protein AAFF_G00029180 [Aldrovandia affinis]